MAHGIEAHIERCWLAGMSIQATLASLKTAKHPAHFPQVQRVFAGLAKRWRGLG